VPQDSHIKSHRFVVVWRAERREIADAADVWRGWVERIPTPRQGASGQEAERIGLQALHDLPDAILSLIERTAAPRRAASDRSSTS